LFPAYSESSAAVDAALRAIRLAADAREGSTHDSF